LRRITTQDTWKLLFIPIVLLASIPSVIAQARRHHDCGRSGWTILVGLLPFASFVLIALCLFQAGDAMPNQYGPPPKRGINWRALWGGSQKN
jgi:uncharacterized membrane protein YhaH (DUF805 family)